MRHHARSYDVQRTDKFSDVSECVELSDGQVLDHAELPVSRHMSKDWLVLQRTIGH